MSRTKKKKFRERARLMICLAPRQSPLYWYDLYSPSSALISLLELLPARTNSVSWLLPSQATMAWKLPKFIPQHGLDALEDYKYSAEDHSILTKLFLKRFWDWVVTLFPMWVAYVLAQILHSCYSLPDCSLV